MNLVGDWEVLEEYSGDKQGYYQVLAKEGTVEVRAAKGKLGFRKEFVNNADLLLIRVLASAKLANT